MIEAISGHLGICFKPFESNGLILQASVFDYITSNNLCNILVSETLFSISNSVLVSGFGFFNVTRQIIGDRPGGDTTVYDRNILRLLSMSISIALH